VSLIIKELAFKPREPMKVQCVLCTTENLEELIEYIEDASLYEDTQGKYLQWSNDDYYCTKETLRPGMYIVKREVNLDQDWIVYSAYTQEMLNDMFYFKEKE